MRFERAAAETIQTAAGRFDALRMGQVDSKKPMRFWLAPPRTTCRSGSNRTVAGCISSSNWNV